MGQGQEGKTPGVAPIAPDLNALVETADGFLEPAGAVQGPPEGLEYIAPRSPSFCLPGQSGLCQTHRGLAVGDRVGDQHTRPGDLVGLCRIGRAAEPLEKVLAGSPNACLVPGYYEGEDMLTSK